MNRREVVYIQTPIESVGWEAMDSMTFSVASPPTSLDSQTFKIDISYENTGPEHNTVLLSNTGINKILQPCQELRDTVPALRYFELNVINVSMLTCSQRHMLTILFVLEY